MRVPSYRKHSSGQARVTINGKDHLLGKYGSPESHQAYGRLIAEYGASGKSAAFGKNPDSVRMCELLLAYLKFAEAYYDNSTEYTNLKLAAKPIADLYADLPSCKFGVNEFKAVRHWWLSTQIDNATMAHNRSATTKPKEPVGPPRYRSRQYVNKQMKRTRRILKWSVASGLLPTNNLEAIKCVEPLKKGRCDLKEAKPITCVDDSLVDATLPHLTQVLADMIRFQRLTGCRPGEVCKIKPGIVDRSSDVWAIELAEHKTAYRGKQRFIFVGARAQAVLMPYLLRPADDYCFSPIESERQRRQARHEARKTPLSWGNKPGSKVERKPRKQPGECYTTGSYAKAIRYACNRAKLAVWSPNQLRHNAATAIRKQFGLEAAQVTLGHSGADVTQVYAEADRTKAIEVARRIG